MSENSYIKDRLTESLRNVLRNADVDGEVRSLLDSGIYATDELKQSVADRYLAPFFGQNKDAQLLILNEMLKATSDRERLELLKDFLEGIPAYSGVFDPEKFMDNLSGKVAERVTPGEYRVGREEDKDTVSLALEHEKKEADMEEEIQRNVHREIDVKTDRPTVEIILPRSPLPPIPPPPLQPQMEVSEDGGSYEKEQVKNARIQIPQAPAQTPQQESQVPETPMSAVQERMNRIGEDVHAAGVQMAKGLYEKAVAEVTTQSKKKTILSRIISPVGVGVATGAGVIGGGSLIFLMGMTT